MGMRRNLHLEFSKPSVELFALDLEVLRKVVVYLGRGFILEIFELAPFE